MYNSTKDIDQKGKTRSVLLIIKFDVYYQLKKISLFIVGVPLCSGDKKIYLGYLSSVPTQGRVSTVSTGYVSIPGRSEPIVAFYCLDSICFKVYKKI